MMLGQPKDSLSLTQLEGIWYINKSNFKMWLKSANHNPTFNYTIAYQKKCKGLKDVVAYQKNKKPKQIIGFDKPQNEQNTQFVWRGKGLLSLFKSKWQIIYYSNEFAIIHFQKTLVTGAGYDVISRQKKLSAETFHNVELQLKELGITDNLQIIQQN